MTNLYTRKLTALALGLLLLADFRSSDVFAQTSVPYTYKNVQILGGGFVSGIVYSQTQKNLIYARTDVGGAYRWNAIDSSWTPITDGISSADANYTGILSIATDPSDPERVYLATGLYTPSWAGTAAVYASADKGTTWTRSNLTIKLGGNEDGRSAGERLQVDPNSGSTLYLGSSKDGLWRSTNYGAAWAKVNSFPVLTTTGAGISFVVFDKSSSAAGSVTKTIYVGVLQTGTNIYKSTDAGVSWQAVAGQPTTQMPQQASLAADGTLYVAYSDGPGPNGITAGSVYKCNTSTNAWTNISPTAGQGGYGGLALDVQKPGTIMVSTLDRWYPHDEVLRSIDYGKTWSPLLGTATFDYSLAPYTSGSTPHWLGDVDIDPFNSNNSTFVTGYGLWATFNLTAADQAKPLTWSFRDKGLEETVVLGLISPPSGAPLVSAVGDIDGFKHDNLDVSTKRLSATHGTNTSIDFAENKPAYMARTYNELTYGSYSNDGGATWIAFGAAPSATTGGGNIAVSSDGNTLVWSPAGGAMSYSKNNGTSWTASTGIAAGLLPVADRANPLKFYVYDGLNGKVFVSTDGGASFSVKATGLATVQSWQLGAGIINTVFGSEGDIWLCAPAGLYHSSNSGISFAAVSGIQTAVKVAFGKAATGKTYPAVYIVGIINNVYGFFRSDDGAATWSRINDDQHQFGTINVLAGDPRVYGRVYLGTGGRGIIHADPVVVTGIISAEAENANSSFNASVYPNPSGHAFTFEATSSDENTILQVVNVFGQIMEQRTIFSGQLITLGENLSTGIYFAIFRNEDMVKVLKIVKE